MDLAGSNQLRCHSGFGSVYASKLIALRCMIASQLDSLDLVLGQPFLRPVIELCRARALVRSH